MKLLRSSKKWDVFVWVCELASYVFVLIYFFEELREIIYFKWRYITKFWNVIDFLIIASAIASGAFSVKQYLRVPMTIDAIRDNPEKYANVEHLGAIYNSTNQLYAVLLLVVFLKVFKYLKFNKTMGQLSSTLKRCSKDISYFLLMFFIVFIAFGEVGCLLFGSSVYNYKNLDIAMFTLLRTTLGNFEYEEIGNIHKVLAPIYFLTFIFLVIFVLLNMFLAIINDTYDDVKIEAPPDELQMSQYLQNRFYKFLRIIGIKKNFGADEQKNAVNTNMELLGQKLEKRGFNHFEIDMFFERYRINPEATIKTDELDDSAEDSTRRSKRLDTIDNASKKLEEIDETIGLLFNQVKSLHKRLDDIETKKKKLKRP
ncbi:unnamed protein product [Acanthoscelides obtectus]|uniref:Polycystin cation channel PKD1/PKD2 domain-containing protein n=1 Tax=Acanthoscelides obtectus TaxID=200917 RepID=A0A9P0P4Q6_ACAOB|nr:unnamed protein product [Acanthoscelides obtectus]CAK1660887.1 Polycystin-2 [Acanthoscelides obtectus]